MELVKIEGKSKKTGKEYTAYAVKIGLFQTPLFFPSPIELKYIETYIAKSKEKDDDKD